MGLRIKSFSDGSFLEYDLGSFDAWCVYLSRPGMERKPPRDEEYFGEMLQLAKKYGEDMLYADFLKVYENTEKSLDGKVLLAITRLAERQYEADKLKVDILFSTLYAGMLAEENKKNTKLGKRIKRLGVHSILKEGKSPVEAANLMKGMGWRQIDEMCKARGF